MWILREYIKKMSLVSSSQNASRSLFKHGQRVALISCAAILALTALANAESSKELPKKSPEVIGSQWELFVDKSLVESYRGDIQFRIQSPQPKEFVMVFDQPWEGNASAFQTIFKDDSIFKMYYRGAAFDIREGEKGKEVTPSHPHVICYAESKDGIHWERPNLGLFEFNGSKKNNIVFMSGKFGSVDLDLGDNAIVFKDENPSAPVDAKYKALVCMEPPPRTLFAMKSADGIHWVPMSDKPVITNGEMDSQNVAFWDKNRKEYRAYWRFYDRSFKNPDGTPARGVRSIRTATSTDFINWKEEADLKYDDDFVDQLYTSQIAPYYRAPQILIGFPTRYTERTGDESLDSLPNKDERDIRHSIKPRYRSALTDSLLISSRDGVNFKKWKDTFLRPGPEREGTWLYGNGFMAWGILETPSSLVGSPPEISLYATENYGLIDKPDQLRRYTIRMDGFVAVHASREGGEVLTKPLTFSGNRVALNFSTSAGGRVRVEIQDESGQPIPGYTLDECSEIFGDSIERIVTWKQGNDVARLVGTPVRLRFVLEDADLFAFGFQEANPEEHIGHAKTVE